MSTLLWISHGLAMAERSQAVIIMALEHTAGGFISVSVSGAAQTLCFHLHDDFFAGRLQHHVFGPVVPVLVGLGLVHDLLEHRPFPGRTQTEILEEQNREMIQNY